MHNLLPLYYCDKGKDFTAFSLGQLVAILTFCTVRPASLFFQTIICRFIVSVLQPNSVFSWFLLMASPFDFKLSVNPS